LSSKNLTSNHLLIQILRQINWCVRLPRLIISTLENFWNIYEWIGYYHTLTRQIFLMCVHKVLYILGHVWYIGDMCNHIQATWSRRLKTRTRIRITYIISEWITTALICMLYSFYLHTQWIISFSSEIKLMSWELTITIGWYFVLWWIDC